jgi:hypothetical protein
MKRNFIPLLLGSICFSGCGTTVPTVSLGACGNVDSRVYEVTPQSLCGLSIWKIRVNGGEGVYIETKNGYYPSTNPQNIAGSWPTTSNPTCVVVGEPQSNKFLTMQLTSPNDTCTISGNYLGVSSP